MSLEIKSKTQQLLIPTLEMQRSLQVLQMSLIELAPWVRLQIEQNPLLEYQEPVGESEEADSSDVPQEWPSESDTPASAPSLYDHLKAQANFPAPYPVIKKITV